MKKRRILLKTTKHNSELSLDLFACILCCMHVEYYPFQIWLFSHTFYRKFNYNVSDRNDLFGMTSSRKVIPIRYIKFSIKMLRWQEWQKMRMTSWKVRLKYKVISMMTVAGQCGNRKFRHSVSNVSNPPQTCLYLTMQLDNNIRRVLLAVNSNILYCIKFALAVLCFISFPKQQFSHMTIAMHFGTFHFTPTPIFRCAAHPQIA